MSDQPVETKKEYEKPAVVYRQAMEAVASVCDPNDPASGGKEDSAICTVISS